MDMQKFALIGTTILTEVLVRKLQKPITVWKIRSLAEQHGLGRRSTCNRFTIFDENDVARLEQLIEEGKGPRSTPAKQRDSADRERKISAILAAMPSNKSTKKRA